MTLRDIADRAGVRVGAAAPIGTLRADETYRSVLVREFNAMTPENETKWLGLQPSPGEWHWDDADYMVDLADEHGMQVRGHTLVWPHAGIPDHVRDATDAHQLRSWMTHHIQTTLDHFRGRIPRWDVVNEPMHWGEGRLAEGSFLDLLGPGYIAEAFTIAHEADPGIELWLNETHADVLGGKLPELRRIVEEMLDADVPLHGIGLQTHCLYPDFSPNLPTGEHLNGIVQTFADYGLDVAITEMDMLTDPEQPDRLEAQGALYEELVDAALQVDGCREITFWGFTDGVTWINEIFSPDRAPLLLDADYEPKPAYDAIERALQRRAERFTTGPS